MQGQKLHQSACIQSDQVLSCAQIQRGAKIAAKISGEMAYYVGEKFAKIQTFSRTV